MATYNGEKYLHEQIDSLLAQTFQDFVIYISDDASTDNTWDILNSYAKQYPEKIILFQKEINSGSSKHNFFDMMINVKDDYVMLCDQDDVWLPGKVEDAYNAVKAAEAKYGQCTPLVIHTDLIVVNKNLEIISPSFRLAMNSNFCRIQLKDQIIQNTLTGCTAMYNRSLAELIQKKPEFMVMHDWWLMLIAAAFGKIEPLYQQTVLYRQHDKNVVGAKNVRTFSYKFNKLLNYKEIKAALAQTYMQAQNFLDVYGNKLSGEQIALLEAYCLVPNMSKFMRWYTVCRLGVLKNGVARKIAGFIFI